MSQVLTKLIFFCISEKLWYKMCFHSPGSQGRNLTDLPPRSISTEVYVGNQICQGIIHYVPFVLALRRNRIRESDVEPLPFLLQKMVFRMYLGKALSIVNYNFCGIVKKLRKSRLHVVVANYASWLSCAVSNVCFYVMQEGSDYRF